METYRQYHARIEIERRELMKEIEFENKIFLIFPGSIIRKDPNNIVWVAYRNNNTDEIELWFDRPDYPRVFCSMQAVPNTACNWRELETNGISDYPFFESAQFDGLGGWKTHHIPNKN